MDQNVELPLPIMPIFNVNETYEFDDPLFNFKKNPPLVPYAENEVGSYRRTFTVPADWKEDVYKRQAVNYTAARG